MRCVVYLSLSLGLITALHETDWKPILGNRPALNIQQPIIVDSLSLKAASSSKSTITFNGQTITTNIGDNDAAGPVLAVDAPDLTADIDAIDGEPRYLGYGGKILNGFYAPTISQQSDQCSVDKYAFEDEGTIQYDVSIPKMEQFTLCAWMRFTNHDGDHSIFTYSVEGEPREIQFWVANSRGSSYFSLAVHGQTLFRLNYPLKLRKWHHACASWNGKTGEWQLWVKAERVGRGFHNRIVSYTIGSNGVSYSGGPSITGAIAPGHHMEITVLQLYKVALSAGKAHRDHKHHHVHHFDYEGLVTSTAQPTPAPQQATSNPFLVNGAVLNRINLNEPTALQTQFLPGQTQFVSGQFSRANQLVQQQFTTPPPPSQLQSSPAPTSPLLFPQQPPQDPTIPQSISASSFVNLNNPANVQFIDDESATPTFNSHSLFKRNGNSPRKAIKVRRIIKRAPTTKKLNKKRALIPLSDGSFIDDKNLAQIDDSPFVYDGLAQFGAGDFQESLTKQGDIEDEIKAHDREAAEGEVNAVLSLCSSCQIEPFAGAVAFTWKDAKIQTEHALKGRSVGSCGAF
ncbi:uncharacterized protein LOC116348800 [Contarinia nasturtii]|uniref:uncharacterized protein LOC116348800 n=1 Tax=Contarinia nasturtii TaxID=265458 RepID=UPI0012D3E03D|nr:uncharacterized protein LOC116348800 [Contarinia nasturtii]